MPNEIKKDDKGIKIRNFAISIYGVMIRDAVNRRIDATDLNSPEGVIWEGSISQVIRDLGINQGYQTLCIRLLTRTECIRKVRDGSRHVPSQYLLLRDAATIPEADWPSVNSIVKSSKEGLTIPPGGYKLLEQRLRGVEERLEGLNIKLALLELQTQITELRKEVESLPNGTK